MSNVIVVRNDFYPRRVYYCNCPMNTFDQIYHANFPSYTEILRGCTEFRRSTIDLVLSKLEREQDCILLCDRHVVLI